MIERSMFLLIPGRGGERETSIDERTVDWLPLAGDGTQDPGMPLPGIELLGARGYARAAEPLGWAVCFSK